MKKVVQFLTLGGLLLCLVSCGPQTPEMQPQVTPPPPVKPLPPLTPTKPISPLPRKIALLLPLSGSQADLGKGLLDAAELALFEGNSESIILLPQDTAEGADKAAKKAIEGGAEIVLGPIFASEVEKVKPLLKGNKVNLLCFSTDQNVAGQGAYILGFLPSQQVERIMGFAKEKGLTKIAAFTPEDQYGQLIDQTLKRLESQGAITLLGITHYTRADLLEGNPGNTTLLEALADYKAKGVDALFLPEGGENLKSLLSLLGPQISFKILGSGQWDTPETIHIQGLEGGYFASTSSEERYNFEERFKTAHGYTPPRIASLAYDATALVIALSEKGYSAEDLTFSQGFEGIDGLFRLTPQGLNERGLAIIEVKSSGFKPVSPAPRSF